MHATSSRRIMATPAQILAELSASAREALLERSDRAGLTHLAVHLGIIVALMGYVAAGLPLWWAAMLPLGVAFVFLFTLQHECTHKTPFKTGILNDIVGHLCALLIVQPFLWFRAFHMAHHRHTNDPEKDPELQGDAKPENWAEFAWHLSCIGYWGGKLQTLSSNALGRFDDSYVAERAQRRLRVEARVLIAVYVAVLVFTLTVSPILIWIWAVPLLLGFPVLRLYLLAEHGRCPTVANMFENTRTTLTNPLVKLIAWNMPYHSEHHAYPNVPFYKLPDAHKVTAPHLQNISDGYVEFTKTYVAPLNENHDI
ncbi:MAG: fatty acid desaturase [Octadecabacter sp.]